MPRRHPSPNLTSFEAWLISRPHDLREVGFIPWNRPHAVHALSLVVDDVQPMSVVVNGLHAAVGGLQIGEDEFHPTIQVCRSAT
jgi:hypothetical protein